YDVRRSDVVVDQKPCSALFRQSAQHSLCSLLNISVFCPCCTQRHSKARKSTQEPCTSIGRTPTNARIQTPETVSILNGQRGLTNAAHTLHRCATFLLCDGSGLILHQNGVKPSKVVSATCKACDTRRHANERSRRGWEGSRSTRGCGYDAAFALFSVRNAYEVLKHGM